MKNISRIRISYIIGLSLIFQIQSCIAQSESVIKDKRVGQIIDSLSGLLNQYYVFPDVAKEIELQLKQEFSLGKFTTLKTDEELAEKINTLLDSVAHDLHMRFWVNGMARNPNRSSPATYNYQTVKDMQEFDFFRTGHMGNGVGYLEIRGFPPVSSAKESVDAAMKTIRESKVLIIDIRRNGGGMPEMVKYICSYFFDTPRHLNSIYWRSQNKTVDFITLDEVGGQKMTGIPIYILTSSKTVSGGEEFAYNMQTQKRGTIIGEITAGGANPANTYSLDNFKIAIPIGMAINPITKTNWEGVGVKPDILTEATKALDLAFEKAILLNK